MPTKAFGCRHYHINTAQYSAQLYKDLKFAFNHLLQGAVQLSIVTAAEDSAGNLSNKQRKEKKSCKPANYDSVK